jgi:Protein of unknown function (DUF4038)/Putative collagen-binding domain of a collagenase
MNYDSGLETRRSPSVICHVFPQKDPPYASGLAALESGVSVGAALIPDDGMTAEEVIHNASVAMYRTKEHLRTFLTTLLIEAVLVVETLAALTPRAVAQHIPSGGEAIGSRVGPVYPLRASANRRYLIDQSDVPFLMVGDSPQNLIANLSVAEAASYMANRRTYGINTLWINLLCGACNKEGKTFDGIAPFTLVGDLSTPNPVYFRRADDMISLAATCGMVVLLDPIETSSWLSVVRTNGKAKAFAYGQYLGNRYKNFSNIVWMHGNDFQSWRDATDDVLVQAVALGIRSTDQNHIHTVELNFLTSGSLDDPSWAPVIELDAAYTYFPTYAQVLTEYNRPDAKPVSLVEANYEFEHNPMTDGGSAQNLRRQEYWTMLSGATGQLYGSAHTWRLERGWEANLDTPGVMQLKYMRDLFVSRKWYALIPDQDHVVVTIGYDGFSCLLGKLVAQIGSHRGLIARVLSHFLKFFGIGSIPSNLCATTASTSDGSLAIAYLPTIRTISVDMSKLAGPVKARWYDPTSGEYVDVEGSPLASSGHRRFRSPGRNRSGAGDWVLVFETVR